MSGKAQPAWLFKEYIAKETNTSIGAIAAAFAAADASGKIIPLSSLKGKYVLLDFWAAWGGHAARRT